MTLTCDKAFIDREHGVIVATLTEKITGNRVHVCRSCLRKCKIDDTVIVEFTRAI